MDGIDTPAPGADGDQTATGGSPSALRLGAQTMDAARGVNRHHELRMKRRYAELARAGEAPTEAGADAPMDASTDASATSP